MYMPAIRSGQAYKLTRPYKGPYRIIATYPNGVELQLVEHLRAKTIHVALNRVRHCPTAITDKEVVVVKPVNKKDLEEDIEDLGSEEKKEGEIMVTYVPQVCDGQGNEEPHDIQDPWERRLRPRSPRTAAS